MTGGCDGGSVRAVGGGCLGEPRHQTRAPGILVQLVVPEPGWRGLVSVQVNPEGFCFPEGPAQTSSRGAEGWCEHHVNLRGDLH